MTVRIPRLPLSLDPLVAEAKRRARRRRLLLAVVTVVAAVATATAVIATRSPAGANTSILAARWSYTRVCRTGGMALTQTKAPYDVVGLVSPQTRVSMSVATASSIAQRTGPQEFQPSGTHSGTPQSVPCDVATGVASTVGNAWSGRHKRQFAIKAGWVGYAGGPTFGFQCALRRTGAQGLAGLCLHQANRDPGTVRVRFSIQST